jgi:hypothetical protein
MADAVTIDNTKEQQLELEMTIQGVDATKETKLCFVIESENMYFGFKAEKGEGDNWVVNLPKLPMLARTTYDYKVVVVSDGYYFEPASGIVTVVGPREVYSSEPKNATVKPVKKAGDKKVEKKKVEIKKKPAISEHLRQREKPISQIAAELMEMRRIDKPKFSDVMLAESEEFTPEPDSKDEKVLQILKDAGLASKQRSKFKLN